MRLNKFTLHWKKVKGVLSDATKISSQEIKGGFFAAKRQLTKVQLLRKRKELFAELGRNVYEAHEDGVPREVSKFFKETELHEIISEIKIVDLELEHQ